MRMPLRGAHLAALVSGEEHVGAQRALGRVGVLWERQAQGRGGGSGGEGRARCGLVQRAPGACGGCIPCACTRACTAARTFSFLAFFSALGLAAFLVGVCAHWGWRGGERRRRQGVLVTAHDLARAPRMRARPGRAASAVAMSPAAAPSWRPGPSASWLLLGSLGGGQGGGGAGRGERARSAVLLRQARRGRAPPPPARCRPAAPRAPYGSGSASPHASRRGAAPPGRRGPGGAAGRGPRQHPGPPRAKGAIT
jgi:hypothetical protein